MVPVSIGKENAFSSERPLTKPLRSWNRQSYRESGSIVEFDVMECLSCSNASGIMISCIAHELSPMLRARLWTICVLRSLKFTFSDKYWGFGGL